MWFNYTVFVCIVFVVVCTTYLWFNANFIRGLMYSVKSMQSSMQSVFVVQCTIYSCFSIHVSVLQCISLFVVQYKRNRGSVCFTVFRSSICNAFVLQCTVYSWVLVLQCIRGLIYFLVYSWFNV